MIFTILGILGFVSIPKEEDPHLKNRFGAIKVIYPGAEPDQIEKKVVAPLEIKLQSITDIKKIETTIRPQYAVLVMELQDGTKDIENSWNEIERELNELKENFPVGVTEAKLDREASQLEAILLSYAVGDDPVELSKGIYEFKNLLESQKGVKEVIVHGDPELGLNVEINSTKLASQGISVASIINIIEQSNRGIPSGVLNNNGDVLQFKSKNSIENVDDLKKLPLLFPRLTAGILSDVSKVELKENKIPNSIVRHNSKRSVVFGLIPEHPIDTLKWGEDISQFVDQFKKSNPRIQLEFVTYQPSRTSERISDLSDSLLLGIISVIVVLGLWMGWRIGMVVALSVPMISIIGFGIYYIGGGVLHQISLAALLLSLGQFIDNVTVIAEGTQRKIDDGEEPVEASKNVADSFKVPMIFATGTAVAAFLPLLSSQGTTSEFTFSIPLIAVITLFVSYFFAIYVTPLLCAFLLKKSSKDVVEKPLPKWVGEIYKKPKLIILVTIVLFIFSGIGFLKVKKEFFPGADRNEFSLIVELPQGKSIFESDKLVKKLETKMDTMNEISSYTSFVGQSTPQYYYSLIVDKRVPHLAEILIKTKDLTKNLQVAEELIKFSKDNFDSQVRVSHKQLMQGPPVKAAIVFDIYGDNLDSLAQFAHDFIIQNKNLKGVQNLRTNAPLMNDSFFVNLNESTALERGFDRNQLSINLLAFSQGVESTYFYVNGERFPIRVSIENKITKDVWDELRQIKVIPSQYKDYSLGEVTNKSIVKTKTSILRKNGKRMIQIMADLNPGFGLNQVSPILLKNILNSLPDKSWSISQGGQVGESDTANLALLRALPLGIIILIGCLLIEFRSFRKLSLVMLSVSLVAVGVTPGLLIGNQPFGFMSLLGILALAGIIVNNSILIIEAIEEARSRGLSVKDSIAKALALRTRPILMTTVMTLLGLLPLAFEKSTLWPPLAWTMISGLIVSTVLSLFFLPACYEILFKKSKIPVVIFAILFLPIHSGWSKSYDLSEIVQKIEESDQWQAQVSGKIADHYESKSIDRKIFYPKANAFFERTMNDRNLFSGSAAGPVVFGKKSYNVGGVLVEQTLLDPAQMVFGAKASELNALSKSSMKDFENQKLKTQVLIMAIKSTEISYQINLLDQLLMNLRKQLKEVDRLYRQGKTSKSDLIKIEVEQVRVERSKADFIEQQRNIFSGLKIYFEDLESVNQYKLSFFESNLEYLLDKSNIEERSDLKSIDFSLASLSKATDASKASYLPKVSLIGRYNNTDQGLIVDNKSWFTLGITVQWSLFDGGAQYFDAKKYTNQRIGLEHQRRSLKKSQSTEQKIFENEFTRLKVDMNSYSLTKKKVLIILDDEQRFYNLGKIPLNQVLETERLSINQQSKYLESVFKIWTFGLENKLSQGIPINDEIFKRKNGSI